MARRDTRALIDAMNATQDPRTAGSLALQLLRHSLSLGHRRLSLKRLEKAVDCGAEVTPDDFQRCLELALRVDDVGIHRRVVLLGRRLEQTQAAR